MSGSSQILVLSVRDVQMGLRVVEILGKTETDDANLVTALIDAHEEVIRLDVLVDEVARADIFDSRDLS